MAIDFQIQEMIYQDADGVLFQALDKQTGHLVALQRFFLPDLVSSRLKEKGEDGKSLFKERLEWLKSLDVPHLPKVVGGGFDELDDTPYFVTQWTEGRSLADAHELGVFAADDGEVFAAQARAVLLALPMESRSAVLLDEDDILISRDDSGALVTSFLLSPRRYFGAAGGMEFVNADREEALRKLTERFPGGAPVAEAGVSPVIQSAVTVAPVLKSAQKSGGGGLLWCSVIALVVILGAGGWLVFKAMDKREVSVANVEAEAEVEVEAVEKTASETIENKEEERNLSEKESLEIEEVASAATAAETAETEALVEMSEIDSVTDADRVAARVAAAQEALEEPEEPVVMVPRGPSGIKVEEKGVEGEVDLFGDDEEGEEKSGSIKEVAGAQGYYTPDDLEALRDMEGEKITFRGKVVESNESGGQKTLWYLDFGNYRTQPFVIFFHRANPTPVNLTAWEAFVGKVVYVKGVVQVKKARGSGVCIKISTMDDIKLEPEKPKEKIYQFSNLDDLRVVAKGEKMTFEGDFKGFRKSGSFVYLFFEDGLSIVGRFAVDGPLYSKEFITRMNELKGKRVRLRGVREIDEKSEVEIAIQLSAQDGLSVAPK